MPHPAFIFRSRNAQVERTLIPQTGSRQQLTNSAGKQNSKLERRASSPFSMCLRRERRQRNADFGGAEAKPFLKIRKRNVAVAATRSNFLPRPVAGPSHHAQHQRPRQDALIDFRRHQINVRKLLWPPALQHRPQSLIQCRLLILRSGQIAKDRQSSEKPGRNSEPKTPRHARTCNKPSNPPQDQAGTTICRQLLSNHNPRGR